MRSYDIAVMRQREQNLNRGPRNMQKETDSLIASRVPQFLAHRDEMVVVHPDEILGLEQGLQAAWQTNG